MGSNLILFLYIDKGNRSKRKKGKRYINISDIKIYGDIQNIFFSDRLKFCD